MYSRGDIDLLAQDHLWRVDWKAYGYPYCGIYAVSPDNRWPTKIGISTIPSQRVAALQTACWRRLDIAAYVYCDSVKDARAVEQKTHKILSDDAKIMNGEWFDIKPDKAMEVVSFAAATLGIEIRNDVPDEKIAKLLYTFTNGRERAKIELEVNRDYRNTIKKPERLIFLKEVGK